MPERQEHITAVHTAAATADGTTDARARARTGARDCTRAAAAANQMAKRDDHARSVRTAESEWWRKTRSGEKGESIERTAAGMSRSCTSHATNADSGFRRRGGKGAFDLTSRRLGNVFGNKSPVGSAHATRGVNFT